MAKDFKRRYLHLSALPISALPSHPALPSASEQQAQPALLPFLTSILTEAADLADIYFSSTPDSSTTKPSPPCPSKVDILTTTLPGLSSSAAASADADGASAARPADPNAPAEEFWAARRSRHISARESGTADWAEFVDGILRDHSQHEKDYTPGVMDAHQVADWKEQIAQETGEARSVAEGRFSEVHMQMYEMVHKLPPPLGKRLFSTLVVGAMTGKSGILVAQMPVWLEGVEHEAVKYGTSGELVRGIYTSVERVRRVKEGTLEAEEDGSEILWEMATASDAGGKLPMWMQKMGVPGAIAKDVGLFMEWRNKAR